jgi:hypothetical protein
MPAIKLHLEQAEYAPIERLAEEIHAKPEAIVYAAVNRLMLDCRRPELRDEILETWDAHKDNLPLWTDSACSVHAYEGKPDDGPHPSKFV